MLGELDQTLCLGIRIGLSLRAGREWSYPGFGFFRGRVDLDIDVEGGSFGKGLLERVGRLDGAKSFEDVEVGNGLGSSEASGSCQPAKKGTIKTVLKLDGRLTSSQLSFITL